MSALVLQASHARFETVYIIAQRGDVARETLGREDVLRTRQGGPPIGGKSKVSKEFQNNSSP